MDKERLQNWGMLLACLAVLCSQYCYQLLNLYWENTNLALAFPAILLAVETGHMNIFYYRLLYCRTLIRKVTRSMRAAKCSCACVRFHQCSRGGKDGSWRWMMFTAKKGIFRSGAQAAKATTFSEKRIPGDCEGQEDLVGLLNTRVVRDRKTIPAPCGLPQR